MIIVATGSIIKNEWKGQGQNVQPMPIGYDEVSGEQLGNGDFLVNAVNYLTGNEKWLSLRSHDYKLRLLNKEAVSKQRKLWEIINIVTPPFLLLLAGWGYSKYRKRKNS